MTNSSPDISFITICYNGFKDTCELIESLHKKLKSVSYEIIVVDNASREDEAAKIHELYPTVISIRSNENGGFSGGNNIGIRAAKGKYIFLINNDTYIESDEIAYLVERLESRPEIGGVSPKIRFAFPPQHIQFAGFTPLTKITLRNNMLGFDCPDDGSYDTPHPTPLSTRGSHDYQTRSDRKNRNDAGNLLPLLRRTRLEHKHDPCRLRAMVRTALHCFS